MYALACWRRFHRRSVIRPRRGIVRNPRLVPYHLEALLGVPWCRARTVRPPSESPAGPSHRQTLVRRRASQPFDRLATGVFGVFLVRPAGPKRRRLTRVTGRGSSNSRCPPGSLQPRRSPRAGSGTSTSPGLRRAAMVPAAPRTRQRTESGRTCSCTSPSPCLNCTPSNLSGRSRYKAASAPIRVPTVPLPLRSLTVPLRIRPPRDTGTRRTRARRCTCPAHHHPGMQANCTGRLICSVGLVRWTGCRPLCPTLRSIRFPRHS